MIEPAFIGTSTSPHLPFQSHRGRFVVRRFVLRAVEDVHLAAFVGSTIRGAIGRNLRQLVCATKMPVCEGCPVRSACSYAMLHDGFTPDGVHSGTGTHAPPPLWIHDTEPGRTLKPGETITFSMAALGPATRSLPFVDEAIRALRRGGLGRGRGPVELLDAQDELQGDVGSLVSSRVEALRRDIEERGEGLRIHLRTPVAIRLKGAAWEDRDRARPSWLERLLGGASRRTIALERRWLEPEAKPRKAFDVASLAKEMRVLEEQVHLRKVRRFSGTQDRHVDFIGAVGALRVAGKGLASALPWLVAGELLSLGSGTTFGFGRVDLEAA